MRKWLISLAVMLPLVGAAAALADSYDGGSAFGQQENVAMVDGTIVSVASNGTSFVADAFVVPQYDHGFGFGREGGPGFGYGQGGGFGLPGGFTFPGFGATGMTGTSGSTGWTGWTGAPGMGGFPGAGGFPGLGGSGFGGFAADYRAHDGDTGGTGATGATGNGGPTQPTETQVTIQIGANTKVRVRGSGSLTAGDHFEAWFTGSPSDSITALTGNPALAVDASPAPQRPSLYAFAGTVTGTTSTSVTVTLLGTYPSSLGAAGSSATFTVGSSTLVLGGASGFSLGSVNNIAKGDIVAGGLIGAANQTEAQVEADPLMLLLDLPVGSLTGATGATGTSGAAGTANLKREKAASELHRAEALLGLKSSKKSNKKSTKKHTTKHH